MAKAKPARGKARALRASGLVCPKGTPGLAWLARPQGSSRLTAS